MKKYSHILFYLLLSLTLSAQNQRYYVDIQAGGQLNGQSWTDAFSDLHDALVLALPGDEIWVAEGTYRPAADDRAAQYRLPSGVRLYGGFAGSEMLLDERQPGQHPTVLSGDIGMPGDSLDNSYNLLYLPYPDVNTLVDGFTLRDAVANKTNTGTGLLGAAGAALYIDGSDSVAYPTIRHCVFEHNTAQTHGGAVYVNGSGSGSVAPQFEDCQFRYNRAEGNGGAVYRDGASWWERPADFTGCTFEYNRAQRGGCIYIADAERSDSTQINASNFYHNFAVQQSTVLAFGRARQLGISALLFHGCDIGQNLNGGIIHNDVVFYQGSILLQIDSCTFHDNVTHPSFGSIAIDLPGRVGFNFYNSSFYQDNSIVYGNSLHSTSGIGNLLPDTALNIYNSSFKKIAITISTNGKLNINRSRFNKAYFAMGANFYNIDNSIFNKNGLEFDNPKIATIQNSVFFKNNITVPVFSTLTDTIMYVNNSIFWPIYNSHRLPFRTLSVKAKNCIFTDSMYIDHGSISIPNEYVTGPTIQIGVDPLFLDTLSGTFRLRPCSPAWNAGDNASALAQGLTTDLDGLPRVADGQVDIGAYELQPIYSIYPTPAVQAACFNQPVGTAQWALQNACPPYTYHWAKDGSTGNGATGLAPGSYQFTITDSRGRTLVQNAQIPTSSPDLQLSGDTLICPASSDGDLLALVNGAIEPLTYHWSTGSSAGSINQLPIGTYSATVTDAIGCKDLATAVVGPSSPPVTVQGQISPAATATTANGSIQVTVQSGPPPYNYAWGEVAANGPIISGLLPGTYHLSVTDGAGCSTPFQFEVGVVSGTTAVSAGVAGRVQPNPAREQAWLRFGDSSTWRLFSVAGLEVLRVEGRSVGQEMQVDFSELPAGVYFYTFSQAGKVISQDRLVILGK